MEKKFENNEEEKEVLEKTAPFLDVAKVMVEDSEEEATTQKEEILKSSEGTEELKKELLQSLERVKEMEKILEVPGPTLARNKEMRTELQVSKDSRGKQEKKEIQSEQKEEKETEVKDNENVIE